MLELIPDIITDEGFIILGLFFVWFISAGLMFIEQRSIIRVFIYFGIFSLVTSICFLLLGAPDVAMAEAAISAFTTVFFVVCFERYYNYRKRGNVDVDTNHNPNPKTLRINAKNLSRHIPSAVLALLLFGLFLAFLPSANANLYLKEQYITYFPQDVGGTNAIGAIYLGYRVYDTLFEALMLVVSVVAVIHMSSYNIAEVTKGPTSNIRRWGGMAVFTIRIISPIIILFGIYLIANGHLTAGGGFQGGLAIAAFFICRYLIYDIYDLPIRKVMKYEEGIFFLSVILAIIVVFADNITYLPFISDYYLVIMNTLIGLKVTCGFIILFYRFIVIERINNPNKNTRGAIH